MGASLVLVLDLDVDVDEGVIWGWFPWLLKLVGVFFMV